MMRSNNPQKTWRMFFLEPGKRQARRPVTQVRRGRRRATVAVALTLCEPFSSVAEVTSLATPRRRMTWKLIGGVDWAEGEVWSVAATIAVPAEGTP